MPKWQGPTVTVHKIYAKKLFEEKVMNVEGSQSKGAEVTMKKKWDDII